MVSAKTVIDRSMTFLEGCFKIVIDWSMTFLVRLHIPPWSQPKLSLVNDILVIGHQVYGHVSLTLVNDIWPWVSLEKLSKKVLLTGCILSLKYITFYHYFTLCLWLFCPWFWSNKSYFDEGLKFIKIYPDIASYRVLWCWILCVHVI